MPLTRTQIDKPMIGEIKYTAECESIVVQFSVTVSKIDLPFGGVAQLGEHLLCKQGVRGSSPLISTKVGERGIEHDR